jgi:hypothetical protein
MASVYRAQPFAQVEPYVASARPIPSRRRGNFLILQSGGEVLVWPHVGKRTIEGPAAQRRAAVATLRGQHAARFPPRHPSPADRAGTLSIGTTSHARTAWRRRLPRAARNGRVDSCRTPAWGRVKRARPGRCPRSQPRSAVTAERRGQLASR